MRKRKTVSSQRSRAPKTYLPRRGRRVAEEDLALHLLGLLRRRRWRASSAPGRSPRSAGRRPCRPRSRLGAGKLFGQRMISGTCRPLVVAELLAADVRLAVVAEEDDDRVVGQAVGLELLRGSGRSCDRARVAASRYCGPVLAGHRVVGIVGRDHDLRRVGLLRGVERRGASPGS